MSINYNYLIPGIGRYLGDNVIVKGVLDGWQLSGVTLIQGGTREGVRLPIHRRAPGRSDAGPGRLARRPGVRSEPAA